MALATFLFGREVSRTQIGAFTVDCTITMTTSFKAELTKNPIQNGSRITDHVNLDDLVWKMEGIISESPIGNLGDEIKTIVGGALGGLLGSVGAKSKIGGAALVGTGLGAAAGGAAASVFGKGLGIRSDPGSYPRTAMKTLIDMYEKKATFTIKTFFFPSDKNNIYTNMLITSLDFPQSTKDGNSLRFSLTAEKINIVSLQEGVVSGEFMKGLQAANSGESKTDLGRQGDEKLKESTQKKVSDFHVLTFGK